MWKDVYLIIAYNEWDTLSKTISLLDAPYHDIIVHIDKKVNDDNKKRLLSCVSRSNLYFIDRLLVNWGGYSLVQVELNLLQLAIKGKYRYYHLLSGSDMPIKNCKEIYDFYSQNYGKEFLTYEFEKVTSGNESYSYKYKYYHLLQEVVGRKEKSFLAYGNRAIVKVQKKLNIDRTKNCNFDFYHGSQWFSISDGLAKYIVSQMDEIKKCFQYGYCVDEIFMQTFAYKSPYRSNLAYTNMRLIDWKRGNPYIWTLDDYEQLISSECLFARKFDPSVDSMIIEKIYNTLKHEE